MGNALNFRAWAATTPELVPREDLVQAIALNGIGFNLSRAVGPAIGGFAIALAGTQAAFALNALCFLSLLLALLFCKREAPRSAMPPEHFLSAMRATILRAVTFFFFTSAVWGMLPLVVRHKLGLGPEAYGAMLGLMGVGAVATSFALPALRIRLPTRGSMVTAFSLVSALSLAILGVSNHWLPATICAVAALAVRGWRLDTAMSTEAPRVAMPSPDAPAAELRNILDEHSGRVFEVVRYQVAPANRAAFLATMKESRRVQLRCGAVAWRLLEDVAHPERWIELWSVESWTEHLREAGRLDAADRNVLARAAGFQVGEGAPEAARYLTVLCNLDLAGPFASHVHHHE
jgi:hypothetical protein